MPDAALPMQGRTGKLDIDYQVLHDAFFKFQTKPDLTGLGDLYYEGKEFEAMVKNAKPGVLSEALQGALGMSPGAPPPWLINMQRYGPPPSYTDLKVRSLVAYAVSCLPASAADICGSSDTR